MKPRTVEQIAALVNEYRVLLARVNGDAAKVLGTKGVELEQAILNEILKRSGKVTPEQVQQIRALIRDIVAQSAKEAGPLMARYVNPGLRLVADRTRQTTTALLQHVSHPRFREALATMRQFEDRIAERAVLRAQFYAQRWARSWSDMWAANLRDVEDQLVEAAIHRESWTVVGDRIAPSLANLKEFNEGRLTPSGNPIGPKGEARKIAGAMHPDAFARAYARTSMGELSQIEGINEAHAIGLRSFTNIGIAGPTQSAICFLASQQRPMTIEEWNRWRRDPANPSTDGGPPKRHVLNCNCELIGIPQAATGDDWKQPSPIWNRSSAEDHLLERMVA